MEFGDDRKILNRYSGEVFGQFPKRDRHMKSQKTVFKMKLENIFSKRAEVERVDRWKWI